MFKKTLIFILLMSCLLIVSPIYAKDINGTDNETLALEVSEVKTYTDLNDQINNLKDNEILNLNQSYKYDSDSDESFSEGVVISRNITVTGKSDVCIDGSSAARGIFIESGCSVILKNLTFTNCFSNNSGGAIFLAENSHLIIDNCVFRNNWVYNSNGGAINAQNATGLEIKNSFFFNNTSIRESDLEWEEFKKGMGSAICQSIGSNMTLIDSVFRNNNAYLSTILLVSYTQGLYNLSNLFVRNCSFENNTSFSSGVIYLDELGKGEIHDSIFKNNHITDHSGVLVLDASVHALVQNCLFDSNNAVNGGVMHIKVYEGVSANVSIVGCNFTKNRASQKGGVIYSNSGIINIINSLFCENSCNEYGGAIYAKKGSIDVLNSSFVSNSAQYGGALYINSDSVSLNNVIFKSNSADNKGDAVYSKIEDVRVINTSYINNIASVSSDVYGVFKAHVTQKSSYFGGVEIKIKLDSLWKTSLLQKIKLKFVGDTTYTSGWLKTDSNGVLNLKVPLNLKVGKYSLSISMESGICYVDSITVNVVKAPSKIYVKKLTTTYKSGKKLKITVKNTKTKKYVSGAKLKIKVWTAKKYKTYTITCDKNGVAKFDSSKLTAGTHKIEITSANKNIQVSKVKSSVKIKKAAAKLSYSKTVKKPSKIKITVKNKASGKIIKKTKFTVKISKGKNIKSFKVKSDKNGIIKISTKKLAKGINKISVTFKSKNYNIKNKISIKIK